LPDYFIKQVIRLSMKDFYYILGTASNASAREIEAAYQKLARKFVDEHDDFIDAHFREIAEAYDVLRDTDRRKKYDAAFKKNQAKQLAAFKLKYLNIALTVTFFAVTALFAAYVIKTIRGHEAKKIVSKPVIQQPVAITTYPKKHHKPAPAVNPPAIADTAVHPETAKPVSKSTTTPLTNPINSTSDSTYTATLHANITGIVYLHQSPDYNSTVLAKIPDAVQVKVLEKGSSYCKISYNGQEGYVLKSSIGQR
jgi:DnaJ-like protein/SH3 domain-containing protein